LFAAHPDRRGVVFIVSKPTKARSRPQFTKAELKAYEARRAEELQRVPAAGVARVEATGAPSASTRRTYALTRDEEYRIIRGDLRRLLLILAILAVVLVAATIAFR